MTYLFALAQFRGSIGFNFIHFAVGLLITFAVLVILILGFKFLARQVGWTVPPELVTIFGIVVFIVLLVMLLEWSGVGIW